MIVCFSEIAWQDYLHWQQQDKKILKKINELIRNIKRNPGNKHSIGKSEILKGELSGYYSKRITREHRLVYKIITDKLIIAQCRFHY